MGGLAGLSRPILQTLAARRLGESWAGDRLVVDASAVVAYLRGVDAGSAAARYLFDELVGTGRNPAILPATAAADILVAPVTAGGQAAAVIRTFLLGFPGLSIWPADLTVAGEAATIRARTAVILADAMVAAVAVVSRSRWLITNDAALRDRLQQHSWQVQVVVLSETRPPVTGRGA